MPLGSPKTKTPLSGSDPGWGLSLPMRMETINTLTGWSIPNDRELVRLQISLIHCFTRGSRFIFLWPLKLPTTLGLSVWWLVWVKHFTASRRHTMICIKLLLSFSNPRFETCSTRASPITDGENQKLHHSLQTIREYLIDLRKRTSFCWKFPANTDCLLRFLQLRLLSGFPASALLRSDGKALGRPLHTSASYHPWPTRVSDTPISQHPRVGHALLWG